MKQDEELKDRLIEELDAYSFNVEVGQDFKNIKIKSHRVLLNWNAQSLNKIQKYILENKAVIFNYLLLMNKNSSGEKQNNEE